MKKTMYIPKGQEMRFENLTCDRLVVDGSLYVDGNLMTKRISGKGFISANVISAESVTVNTIDAGKIIADRLIAVRVIAVEIHAVQSMAVSSYVEADYVKAGKVTIADAEICDMEADEVVKLSVKRRSLLRTLFASFVRAKWTALTCRETKKTDGQTDDAENEAPVSVETAADESDDYQFGSMSPEMADALNLMNEPEFLRLRAMYKLARETGDIWQIVPKKEPTDRVVTYAHPFAISDEKAA